MANPSLRVVTRRPLALTGAPTHYMPEITAPRPMTAQQRLDQERQRREAFLSTLAHELRQPLATLLAAVEVVRLSSADPTTDRAIEIMKRQIAQMNRVVEDLLDAARWSSGKVTLRKRRLDVRDVVREAARDVAAAVAEHGHDLVVTTAPEPLLAEIDGQRLHQVLSNLLRNAIKYTNPGGRIALTAQREGATLTLCISDTGRGIEPGDIPHIFELYSQVRPAEAAGVGIGLSVVREIVAAHGGWIVARSAGAGSGSEFVVTLPFAAMAEDAR